MTELNELLSALTDAVAQGDPVQAKLLAGEAASAGHDPLVLIEKGLRPGMDLIGADFAEGQLHMRSFRDGDTLVIEPWRAGACPVIKDLVVDRSAFDAIIAAGGFVSVATGSAPDGNAIPVPKQDAESAMDAAACIGCGACVAVCPNASAMLFTGAKVSQLALLPQGQPERAIRVRRMVAAMDAAGFGGCTNHGECESACPKGISLDVIARMNRDFLKATLLAAESKQGGDGAG